jgi:cystathionine beta-lyase/cystathionine gamma-synthase
MNFQTLAIHTHSTSAGRAMPTSPPIDRSTSWAFESMADLDAVFEGGAGFMYGRDGMPNASMLEDAISALEAGPHTLVYATGMAAIAGALALPGPQGRILAAPDLYGRTFALLQSGQASAGAEVRFVSGQDHPALAAALASWRPHLLVVETLSNPLVKVSDLPWLAECAHAAGCKVLVDNTFASPYLCRPAEWGVDFTVESLTKYINGHGDVLGGSITVLDAADHSRLARLRSGLGATLDPHAAWLTLRGLRTLGLRMQQHSANALALARFLAAHPAVARVYYPGLPTDPGHLLARRLFADRGFGGMLAFDLAEPTRDRAWAILDRLRLALRAPTLGDIATLVAYPAHASHRALSPAQRAAARIGDGLIRVSVGIEDAADIIADFDQALKLS